MVSRGNLPRESEVTFNLVKEVIEVLGWSPCKNKLRKDEIMELTRKYSMVVRKVLCKHPHLVAIFCEDMSCELREKAPEWWSLMIDAPFMHVKMLLYMERGFKTCLQEYIMEATREAIVRTDVSNETWLITYSRLMRNALYDREGMYFYLYLRKDRYIEFESSILHTLPYLIDIFYEKTSRGNRSDVWWIEHIISAVLCSANDRKEFMQLLRRVPAIIRVVDYCTCGVRVKDGKKRSIDEEMIDVALGLDPSLFYLIRRGYMKESLVRWGVRNGADMRVAYSKWGDADESIQSSYDPVLTVSRFRDFYFYEHYEYMKEIFLPVLLRVLPFPKHLTEVILSYLAVREPSLTNRQLPRRLPVHVWIHGEWVAGHVRKIWHPQYEVELTTGEMSVRVMDCNLSYSETDFRSLSDGSSQPIVVEFS